MLAKDEAADLKNNPLPDCGTCAHGIKERISCLLLEEGKLCDYVPDADHDETLPLLEQAYRLQVLKDKAGRAMKDLQDRYDRVLTQVIDSKIENQGQYSLVDKKRTVRVPDVVKFKAQYGQEYQTLKQEDYAARLKKLDEALQQDLVSLPVKRAEELIGKDKLNAISEAKVYHNYQVVSSEDHHAGL